LIAASFADGRMQAEDLLAQRVFPLGLSLSFFFQLQQPRDKTVPGIPS
jgi:hypothetical protein